MHEGKGVGRGKAYCVFLCIVTRTKIVKKKYRGLEKERKELEKEEVKEKHLTKGVNDGEKKKTKFETKTLKEIDGLPQEHMNAKLKKEEASKVCH